MAEKFVPRHTIMEDISRRPDKTKLAERMIRPTTESEGRSKVEYKEVNIREITPRCVNKYRQSRIEQLAASIHNTNDRLIHPIVLVRGEDLPEGHEVRKEIEDQGKNISDYRYIIVSGERRYHAWMLLWEQEQENIKGTIRKNKFDTITANILTREEAENEQAYYADANNMARHLSPAEGVWFIKDALAETVTNEQKRAALVKMNGGSEEGIDVDPDRAAKHFRVDNYCRTLLENELGVTDWSDATLRNMATVATKCDTVIVDALLEGKIPLREAKVLSTLSPEEQTLLLHTYQESREKYEEEISRLKGSKTQKEQRVTHADTRRLLKANIKSLTMTKKDLEKIAAGLGGKNNRNEMEILKKYEEFISQLKECVEKTK